MTLILSCFTRCPFHKPKSSRQHGTQGFKKRSATAIVAATSRFLRLYNHIEAALTIFDHDFLQFHGSQTQMLFKPCSHLWSTGIDTRHDTQRNIDSDNNLKNW